MRTFIKRFISSLLFILLVVFTLFIAPTWFFSLITTLLIGVGLYEFYTMVEKRDIFVFRYFGIILGVLVPLSIHLKAGGIIPDIEPLLIVLICLITVMVQLTRRDSSEALKRMSVTLFGILYISWLFSFIIKIKFLTNGAPLCAFLILVTKGGDIGAYLVGSLVGKHALIPRISPKKSVEGLIGGLLFSFVIAILFRPFLQFIPFYHILILGALLGILGQMGDLSESLIKRDCDVKDASSIFPGLGGALDILDSLLFTTPVFYFYLKMLFNL
ncbi:MAG: phosphatidate cytidylyltransferase [Candidatus Omnitrophica bacterium]|nr:phosphatidate cytidylyltransferase [Candidatus Omnitrophota bacterium]